MAAAPDHRSSRGGAAVRSLQATADWNALVNARQFSIPPTWPREHDYPDTVYDDTLRFEARDVTLELIHGRGETDDHTWLWWSDHRALFTGDLFIWVSPSAGNPQKVQRYAGEWASALRAMAAREPAGRANPKV
jgi:glyoxylase-like metal-dependent hydrolase (beta-lactamase superfamily II)